MNTPVEISTREARDGFAIYVHWPFCRSKCPYCDFNSHVREHVDEEGWREALLRELDHYARETSDRTVGSIFLDRKSVV